MFNIFSPVDQLAHLYLSLENLTDLSAADLTIGSFSQIPLFGLSKLSTSFVRKDVGVTH